MVAVRDGRSARSLIARERKDFPTNTRLVERGDPGIT
jgi:hypothetical protein